MVVNEVFTPVRKEKREGEKMLGLWRDLDGERKEKAGEK